MIKRNRTLICGMMSALTACSLIPSGAAMASDTVARKEGKIYHAVAYKDGKSYIDGSVENKNEDAYYYANNKFNDVDKIDSGDEISQYGSKYVDADDHKYYLNLDDGKVSTDNMYDDDIGNAEFKTRQSIRRHNDRRYVKSAGDDLKNAVLIEGSKYKDPYYEIFIDADGCDTQDNGNASKYLVYTNTKGEYVDADYSLGKVNVVSSNKVSTLENTKKDSNGVRAAIRHIKTIGQDKDNIYRLALLTINRDNIKFGNKSSGVNTATTDSQVSVTAESGAVNIYGSSGTTSVLVLQKISKAQSSDKVDGAFIPKNVNTYMVSNEKGAKINLLGLDSSANTHGFTIADGKIISYSVSGSRLRAETISLKSKNGYYYTDLSNDDDTDLKEDDANSNSVERAYTTDVDGNLWAVDSGEIKKWNNDKKWEKIYKVDGSMSCLSVYDKNNIVVWDEDDKVYSIIAGKSSSNDNNNTSNNDTNKTAAKNGWVQDGANYYFYKDGNKVLGWVQSPASGLWYYMDKNTGIMLSSKWVQDGANWYYLNSDGSMATGWKKDGGLWYYLNPKSNGTKGAMMTGWIQDKGKWYYLNPISNGTKGAMKTGWINDRGTYYYLYTDGSMARNTYIGKYRVGASGAWIK